MVGDAQWLLFAFCVAAHLFGACYVVYPEGLSGKVYIIGENNYIHKDEAKE
jgi:hypothetical protein